MEKAHHDQMPSDVEMETRYLLGDYDSDSGATEAKAKTATGLLSETNLELLEKYALSLSYASSLERVDALTSCADWV